MDFFNSGLQTILLVNAYNLKDCKWKSHLWADYGGILKFTRIIGAI